MPFPPAAARGRPVVVALDVGTSSCRASLYDAGGRHVRGARAQLGYLPRTTPDGGAELDPDELVQHVCTVLDDVSAAISRRYSVAGIGMDTFWHSLLGVDETGQAVTPIYLWLDARSRAQAQELAHVLDEHAVHARTGCMLHWSYWPAKLLWLRQTRPDLLRHVRRWLSFGEYLALRLFGHAGVSVSMASGTGLLNQHTCDWDDALLEAVGVTRDHLSPVVPLTAVQRGLRPAYATRWPCLADVPWLPAVGDGATSNLGSGCASRERFALTIGTSGAERVVWRTDTFQVPPGAWCYRVDAQRIVLGGATNDGGSLFAWLERTLRLPPHREVEPSVAAMQPDAHGLTVLPFWAGERSPGWAPDARGTIHGLRLHTQPIEILRASLEAVALHMGRIDAALRQAVPDAAEVVASGGALLRSPTWLQMMADVLNRPILASAEREASSRGAALLALETLGLLPAPIEQMQPPVSRVYQPIPEHVERYQAAAERQQRLYEALVMNHPS